MRSLVSRMTTAIVCVSMTLIGSAAFAASSNVILSAASDEIPTSNGGSNGGFLWEVVEYSDGQVWAFVEPYGVAQNDYLQVGPYYAHKLTFKPSHIAAKNKITWFWDDSGHVAACKVLNSMVCGAATLPQSMNN